MTERKILMASSCLGLAVALFAAPAMAGASALSPLPPSYVPDLEPPNPVAGECYARVEIPAQYETINQRVVTRDAYQRLSVQQPRLETTTHRVMVKEPSVRYEVRQPSYGTVNQQILTRPGFERLTVSEPSFKTVAETVHHGRPRLVWKRGNPVELRAQGYVIHSVADGGVGGQGYTSTRHYGQTGGQRCGSSCDIWCLVEEPAESVTVHRQKLVSAGQVHRTPVPPAYKTITKQVVTDPGGVRKIPVPAEYANVPVQKLLNPGGVAKIDVPAEYGHAQGRRLVSESRYEWRRIVCQPGVTRSHHSAPVAHSQIGQAYQTAKTHQTVQTHTTHNQGRTIVQAPTSVHYSTSHSPALAGGHYGTTYGASGTIVRTHPSVTGSSYRSHPLQIQSTGPVVTVPLSADHPDRTYTGPAYVDPRFGPPPSAGQLRR